MKDKRKLSAIKHGYLGLDSESLKHSLANRLEYSAGKGLYTVTPRDWFHIAAWTLRNRLMERWMEAIRTYYETYAKRVYYLPLEFMMGRTLSNSALNLGTLLKP